jgi:hypothetical protein
MRNRCYVTGTDKTVRLYEFGTFVSLPLCEEANARYVLRAKTDPVHQEIQGRLTAAARVGDEIIERGKDELGYHVSHENMDKFIDMQLEAGRTDLEIMKLAIEKAASCVRILREMKAEFAAKGTLA